MGENELLSLFHIVKSHSPHLHSAENPQSIKVAPINGYSHIKFNYKTCRRKYKKNYHDPGEGKHFLRHVRHQSLKKWEVIFIKIKIFFCLKENIKKMKRHSTDRKKLIAISISNRGLVSWVSEKFITKNKGISSLNVGKRLRKTIPQRWYTNGQYINEKILNISSY